MASDIFERLSVRYIADLIRDFPRLEDYQAAAFPGNFGVESTGFTDVTENNPRSGRGGLGHGQWTGPRRLEFEAYLAKRQAAGMSAEPDDYQANYGMLFRELEGGEGRRVLPRLYLARDADDATEVVMVEFERPAGTHGVPGNPHLDKRRGFARRALAAFRASGIDAAELRAQGRPGGTVAPGNTGIVLPPGTGTQPAAGSPIGGMVGIIQSHKEDARKNIMGLVGIFNAFYPDDMMVVQPKAVPVSTEPTGTPPSVKASAGAFAIGAILQMLGVVPPPEVVGPILGAVQPPTTAGTLTTFLPILAGIVGKFGGFSPLAGIGSTILDMIVKRRTAAKP
jgi:hypothetical protein